MDGVSEESTAVAHLARRASDGDGIGGIVARLREIAAALPQFQAAMHDGEAWAAFDVAVAELHVAIVALEELHAEGVLEAAAV